MAHKSFFLSSSVLALFMLLQPRLQSDDIMQLKYQKAISNLKLTITCPDGCAPVKNELEVYRVSFDPITHEDNFLPNVIFDVKHGINHFDYTDKNKDEVRKCSRCGASFFKTQKKATAVLAHFTKKNKDNSGYNCIAKGNLDNNDGLIKNVETSDHVTLYEYEKAVLHKKFEIVRP